MGQPTRDFIHLTKNGTVFEEPGQVTIVRVLNTGGYSADFAQVFITGSTQSGSDSPYPAASGSVAFVLAPSRGGSDGTVRLDGVTVTKNPTLHEGDYTSFTLNVSGSNFGEKLGTDSHKSYSLSFNTSSKTFTRMCSRKTHKFKSQVLIQFLFTYISHSNMN